MIASLVAWLGMTPARSGRRASAPDGGCLAPPTPLLPAPTPAPARSPPEDMPLAAHVAALRSWAEDLDRRPDGSVLAKDLQAAYGEMCCWHHWSLLPWEEVAQALRAETGLVKRYAWVPTPHGSRRWCVYDLPGRGVLSSRPNFKAAAAASQPRGAKGRFMRVSQNRRAA